MLLTQTSSRHAGKSNDRGRKTPSRRLVRSCWRAAPQSFSSVTFCSFLLSALPRPVVPFCAPLVPSTVPLMACEERCCLTMPPLLKLLSTAAGTNAAQTAIATSRPNAAGDDYDAVDNERQILTLLTASIRMAGRSMSGMRGAALWRVGTGHGPPPIPSLTLFVEQVLRGEAQSPPGTARRGSAARQGGLFFTALDLGRRLWPLRSCRLPLGTLPCPASASLLPDIQEPGVASTCRKKQK